MDMLEMMMRRRSIRKYRAARVEREKLEKIQEAGLYAPNPGGRQGSKIIMLDDAALIDRIGVINANCENRNWDRGVSTDQPSIIDDRTIRSGFYQCPALGIVCVPEASRHTVNGIGAAFVCAENMVLEAYALGVSSCIVGRAGDAGQRDCEGDAPAGAAHMQVMGHTAQEGAGGLLGKQGKDDVLLGALQTKIVQQLAFRRAPSQQHQQKRRVIGREKAGDLFAAPPLHDGHHEPQRLYARMCALHRNPPRKIQ